LEGGDESVGRSEENRKSLGIIIIIIITITITIINRAMYSGQNARQASESTCVHWAHSPSSVS
jgi:hypothetical protein